MRNWFISVGGGGGDWAFEVRDGKDTEFLPDALAYSKFLTLCIKTFLFGCKQVL